MSIDPVSRNSISRQITEQLRAAIVDGQLAIGERQDPALSDIVAAHRRRLESLRRRDREQLHREMDGLLDYLLEKFEQASRARFRRA